MASDASAEGASLTGAEHDDDTVGQPYPFFLAHPWEGDPQTLEPLQAWQVEWKYDGIRAQVVRRAGQTWIWSRGEELITERFPEVESALAAIPDGTVLDGELLAWRAGENTPMPFARLQQRLNRKTVTRKVLGEVPVVFLAYDLLEWQGLDIRGQVQQQRRECLELLGRQVNLRVSELLPFQDFSALKSMREGARQRDRKSTRLNSSHIPLSRMPSSA